MKRVHLLICVCLLQLVGVRARAGGETTEALIQAAASQYGVLELEKALATLEKAYTQPGNSRLQLVRILHLWGLCLAAKGDYRNARLAYAELLVVDPAFRMGHDVAPRLRTPFEDVLNQGPPRLEVDVVPPPAAVPGKPLVLTAKVPSNPASTARGVRIWLRRGDAGAYAETQLRLRGTGEFPIYIPEKTWARGSPGAPVFWYAVVENRHGGELRTIGDAGHPMRIRVGAPAEIAASEDDTTWYESWWFWTLVGAAVVAGTTTAVILATSGGESGPMHFTIGFDDTP